VLVLRDSEVASLITMGEAVHAVEEAFRALSLGQAQMPAKVYLDFPQHSGDLRVMPAAIGDHFAGVKLVNSHPGNPSKGLPTVVGTYLLFSQETGLPLCLMGATALTGMRTGAGSAVATKYLARRGSKTIGLIGAGIQALYQVEALDCVMDFDQGSVWGPSNDIGRRNSFIEKARKAFPDVTWKAADSIEEAAAADVVCTTTPSRSPIVKAAAVRAGTHINAVGADGPGKQELDPELFKKALVIVDDMHQASGGGEVNVALSSGQFLESDIAGTLPDLIAGKISGRTSPDQITIFDSTGLAIQDIALAPIAYARALEEGLGTEIDV